MYLQVLFRLTYSDDTTLALYPKFILSYLMQIYLLSELQNEIKKRSIDILNTQSVASSLSYSLSFY